MTTQNGRSKHNRARPGASYLRFLTVMTLLIVAMGSMLAGATVLTAGFIDGAFNRSVCLQRICLAEAMHLFKAPLQVLSGTLVTISAVATIGGIFVALQSYLSSVKATAFSNHIAQMNSFLGYIASEVAKRPRVAAQSVDGFHWYRLIFEHAGVGELTVSCRYVVLLESLANAIETSNRLADHPSRDRFKYVDHQKAMIDVFAGFGVSAVRQPRVEFFEIESEVISLIRTVNFAFCPMPDLPKIPARSYV